MKIAFPIETFCGRESLLHPQIPSAPSFAIADTDGQTLRHLVIKDPALCKGNTLDAIFGTPLPDAIVVGSVGTLALNALRQAGIRVYRNNKKTVGEVLDDLANGALLEVASSDPCVIRSSCGSGCDTCASTCPSKKEQ